MSHISSACCAAIIGQLDSTPKQSHVVAKIHWDWVWGKEGAAFREGKGRGTQTHGGGQTRRSDTPDVIVELRDGNG
jgi:hypothetical protein